MAAGFKASVPNSISSLVTSSCRDMIRPPYLYFKAWLIEKSSPQPSHLRGRPSGDRE
jgi:hypothetical protein